MREMLGMMELSFLCDGVWTIAARILLLVVLTVVLACFVYVKCRIARKEKEKERKE